MAEDRIVNANPMALDTYGTPIPPQPKWATALLRYGDAIGAALMAPGTALRGGYDQAEINPVTGAVTPFDPRMIGDAANLAGMVSAGSFPIGRPSNSLGMGALRDRYRTQLMEAAPGKDVQRIKLTPERIEIAKQALLGNTQIRRELFGMTPEQAIASRRSRKFGAPKPLPPQFTKQNGNAVAFALEARRLGHDVRIKYPDGPGGSVYVRVGNKGTVRFSDHATPTEFNPKTGVHAPVGGFSTALGRRHYPATMSVDPKGGASLQDAIKWLGGASGVGVTATAAIGQDGGEMKKIRYSGQYMDGADPRLVDILTKAAAQSGYEVEFKSGYRPGDTRQHGKKNALDITLIDPQTGKRLPDYKSPENFRAYEQFAQVARQVQRAEYPDLDNSFRWGGYFSGGKKKYGAMDLMHFDLAGDRIGMGGGSWSKGLTSAQRALWPGVESVGFNDHPVPKGYIPQVATALDTAPASVMPASLSPGLQQRRAATLPTYNITPVPNRRSDKNIDNRKEQATVMGGINLPLQNAMMPPQPPMKPAAGGYKTAGKEFLNDQRFASGMADKTAPGTPRVASLGPMPPLPMPRPQSPMTAMPNTVAPGLITDTFATLGFERDSGGVKVADLYKGILPIAPLAPRPVPGQSYAGQDRAMPQLPPAPIPMPRSMRPADPGLNGNPSFQFGTPGLPAGLPAQVPPTRALPPMPRPRPMMPPMVTVSGAAPRAMPPMPLPRPMGMPVQQFQAQGLSPQQAYAAANQAAQERAIANSRDPERNAARAALAARWGFD